MEKPKCFAIWWENIPGPSGDNCRQCALKDDCLAEFATSRLPLAQRTCNGLTALAAHLEVDEQAVLLAMAYTKRPKQTPLKATADRHSTKAEAKTPKTPKKKAKKKKRKVKKKARKRNKGWGKHTHEPRWNRERERNPEIAQLTPGTVLTKEHKGVDYVVKVKKIGYIHNRRTFPTLAQVTEHIAGLGARRNTVKFWNLETVDG